MTVIDDYSRFILAWELKSDMAAGSLIDVVQKAVDSTGMTGVPVEDRTVLLSDNGPGYLSRQFSEYLGLALPFQGRAGRDQAHHSLPLPPSDQRQDREIPPHYQRRD